MKEFVGIQYLRGLAALAVVIYHVGLGVLPAELGESFGVVMFSSGVDVFFAISGFIIWMSSGKPGLGPGRFWASRLLRVVPLYWLTLLATLGQEWLRFQWHGKPMPSTEEVLRAFFFLFTTNSRTGLPDPYFVPGWSLNYEMFFYLLIGATLLLGNRMLRFALVVATFAVLVALRRYADVTDAVQFRYTSPIQFEFVAGMAMAVAYPWMRRMRWMPVLGLLAIVAAALAVMFVSPKLFPHGARVVYSGLPAMLLVFGALCVEPLLARRPIGALLVLGDASYSLYLTHTVTWMLPEVLIARFGLLSPWIMFPLCCAYAIACAVLVYKLVELPLLRWGKRLLSDGRPQPGVAPV